MDQDESFTAYGGHVFLNFSNCHTIYMYIVFMYISVSLTDVRVQNSGIHRRARKSSHTLKDVNIGYFNKQIYPLCKL